MMKTSHVPHPLDAAMKRISDIAWTATRVAASAFGMPRPGMGGISGLHSKH